jgi:hypothetical protein
MALRQGKANGWSPLLCLLSLLTILTVALEPVAKGSVGRSTAVGFDLYRGYSNVVRGSAGPEKDLNFLLDKGASFTVLDRRLARVTSITHCARKVGFTVSSP